MYEEAPFTPTQTWELVPEDPFASTFEAVRQTMNGEDTAAMIDRLQASVERDPNGIATAILRGETPEEYSADSGMVLFDSASVGLSANRLVKGETVRQVFKELDIRDEAGKLLPIAVVASPGPGSSLRGLTREERDACRHGDFGAIGREALSALAHRDLGALALGGPSQGAALAAAATRETGPANTDIFALAVADPPNIEDRSVIRLARDLQRASDLSRSVEIGGISAQEANLNATDLARFVTGLVRRDSIDIVRGLGHDSFQTDIAAVLDNPALRSVVIGYGSDSLITKPAVIEPQITDLLELDSENVLASIRINGADHTWGDNLATLSCLYAYAIQRRHPQENLII